MFQRPNLRHVRFLNSNSIRISIYWKDVIIFCVSFNYMNSRMHSRRQDPDSSLGFQKFSHSRIPRHRDCLRCNICRLAPN